MKNLVLSVVFGIMSISTVNAQSYVQEGKTFKAVSTRSGSSSTKDSLATGYTYEDTKGNKYPIFIKKGTGRCYIWKKSGKTGKMYKMYLSGKNEGIAMQIAKSMGIEYKPKQTKAAK